jgi:transcriptional regulator with XRE-family HTH domain
VPDTTPWLSSRTISDVELNPDLQPEVLREYRKSDGINQADLAQILNFDQSYVSKIENGQRQVRDVETLLRIAQQLEVPPNRLGLSPEPRRPVTPPPTTALVGVVDPVESDQTEWRTVRRRLNRSRGAWRARPLGSTSQRRGSATCRSWHGTSGSPAGP